MTFPKPPRDRPGRPVSSRTAPTRLMLPVSPWRSAWRGGGGGGAGRPPERGVGGGGWGGSAGRVRGPCGLVLATHSLSFKWILALFRERKRMPHFFGVEHP